MKTETYTCDITGCCEIAFKTGESYQLVTTEFEFRGKKRKASLILQKLDLCENHLNEIISKRRYIQTEYDFENDINYYTL